MDLFHCKRRLKFWHESRGKSSYMRFRNEMYEMCSVHPSILALEWYLSFFKKCMSTLSSERFDIFAKMTNQSPPLVIYALDFDGVLVDSAAETGQSGLAAAKILFPGKQWIHELDNDSEQRHAVIKRFCMVRPCLETGWEAALLIKLLADPEEGLPTNEEILNTFQSRQKSRLMETLGLSKETCNDALRKVRNEWIERNNAQDWIDAHGFFEGGCDAVKEILSDPKVRENVYVITTKAKDYAKRLMEQRGLYATDDSKIIDSHIYGLGSGPKAQVLSSIMKERQADIAVMVEDNLKTLEKIMNSDIQEKTLPVLACWGYNTANQQEVATENHYVTLSNTDSSSLSKVLSDSFVLTAFQEFQLTRK